MPDVNETKLPGVGVRHDFATDGGQALGVLVHHDGHREILVYDDEDPDACSSVLKLNHDETRTLAELLGATQVTEEVSEVEHSVDGQSIAWVQVRSEGPVAGATIGERAYRTRTGASIVAVIRQGEPIPAPEPDFVLRAGDWIIAVGDASGLEALRTLVRR
ncbi:MAG: cation:proton antiporter regulatory subunit [Actinomycetota bacterium]